jgi:short-subunit dehydrogenase
VADPFRLDGRTIIVTGASRGIGAVVARAISAQGGAVVAVARSAD